MTIIERCVFACVVVIVAVVWVMISVASAAETETSTATEALHFAVKQISDGELTGVIAGLVLVFGAVMRNAAVRAALPVLAEWLASRWTRKRRDGYRAKRRRKE